MAWRRPRTSQVVAVNGSAASPVISGNSSPPLSSSSMSPSTLVAASSKKPPPMLLLLPNDGNADVELVLEVGAINDESTLPPPPLIGLALLLRDGVEFIAELTEEKSKLRLTPPVLPPTPVWVG